MTDWEHALSSLQGLSIGDALGNQYYIPPGSAVRWITQRRLPPTPWQWTDDTCMSMSIVEVLAEHGTIDQDDLIRSFVEHFDSRRHYGPGTQRLLAHVAAGGSWREARYSLLDGTGSAGNGAAMRVAPLGACLANSPLAVVEESAQSAEVTHAHVEGIAGAIAVAVAAALAATTESSGAEFLDLVAEHVPPSSVRDGLHRARGLRTADVKVAVRALGNGANFLAQDTVPFALWTAAQHLNDYVEAVWLTLGGLGDRDTTCAITGGVVSARVGRAGVPLRWLTAREPLPSWFERVTYSHLH